MHSGYDSDEGGGAELVTIVGTVKWFNSVEGFGFVSPGDGSADVFLHLSCLRDAGYDGAEEGASITCEAARRPKGLQAVKVIQLDNTSGPQPAVRRPPKPAFGGGDRFSGNGFGGERPARQSTPVATGGYQEAAVKWFNPIKGYGFLSSTAGGQDIFIHMEVLRRAGIAELVPGQAVRVKVGDGPKGPQVAEIDVG